MLSRQIRARLSYPDRSTTPISFLNKFMSLYRWMVLGVLLCLCLGILWQLAHGKTLSVLALSASFALLAFSARGMRRERPR